MGLSRETVVSDLHKSDSVKFRLWWLKNKVWGDVEVARSLGWGQSDINLVKNYYLVQQAVQ